MMRPAERRETLMSPMPAIAIVVLATAFALTHAYSGIVGDAQIYVGRALADLDPSGVGRDMMFEHDGQSGYSLFRPLASFLLAHLSPASMSALIAACANALWFAGIVCFAGLVLGWRCWPALVLVFLLPTAYGPIIRFAETIAVPRPFAEAFVLLALAAFARGRPLYGVALLGLALAFHPIMALAGIATAILFYAFVMPRVVAIVVAGGLLIAALGYFGVAPFDRAFVMIDPEWRATLDIRNTYLRPEFWPASALGLCFVQAVTLIVAGTRFGPIFRRLSLAALCSGLAGLLATCLLDLFWPSVLGLQLQFWRMWWLTAVVACVALGALALDAGRSGRWQKMQTALLVAAWIAVRYDATIAVVLALAVLFVQWRAQDLAESISGRVVAALWIALFVFAFALCVPQLQLLHALLGDLPATWRASWLQLSFAALQDVLIVAVAAGLAFGLAWPDRFPRIVGAALACAAAVVAALLWNDANSFDRTLDRGVRQQALADAFGPEPGAILWLNGTIEPWLWLGRPNWASLIQGAGLAFDRRLALLYSARTEPLVARGFMKRSTQAPVADPEALWFPRPDASFIAGVCRDADAPRSLIVPLRSGQSPPPEWKALDWPAPAARVEFAPRGAGLGAGLGVLVIDHYAAIPCAAHR
jgi:hypothetical protein